MGIQFASEARTRPLTVSSGPRLTAARADRRLTRVFRALVESGPNAAPISFELYS